MYGLRFGVISLHKADAAPRLAQLKLPWSANNNRVPGAKPNPADKPLDRSDLLALFGEIRPELMRLVQRRTGNPDTAADLVQDISVKLMTLRTVLPDRDQARAYIFRMAMNIATDLARTNARRAQILAGAQVLFEDVGPDPETVAVARDQIRQVEKALDELNPKCREVLILARVHGLAHKEIARQLGVSVSSVEKYQIKALRHCRQRLNF